MSFINLINLVGEFHRPNNMNNHSYNKFHTYGGEILGIFFSIPNLVIFLL